MDETTWAKDTLYVEVLMHFSWIDRLKMLIGWWPSCRSEVACEVPPGRTLSQSRVMLLRPKWWPRRRQWGMAEVSKS